MTEHHIIPVEPKPGETLDDFTKRLFDDLGPGYKPIRVGAIELQVSTLRDVIVSVPAQGMASFLRPRSFELVSGIPGDVYAQRELAMLLYAARLEEERLATPQYLGPAELKTGPTYKRALELLREQGEDVDQLIKDAAKNLRKHRRVWNEPISIEEALRRWADPPVENTPLGELLTAAADEISRLQEELGKHTGESRIGAAAAFLRTCGEWANGKPEEKLLDGVKVVVDPNVKKGQLSGEFVFDPTMPKGEPVNVGPLIALENGPDLMECLPSYYDSLSESEKTRVALGALRPRVGERWPPTFADWLWMNGLTGRSGNDFRRARSPEELQQELSAALTITQTITNTLRLYVIEDGEKHWILAEDEDDAQRVFQEAYDTSPEGEITPVSEHTAKHTRFIDADAETVPTLYDACVKDPRRRLVGSTEW